MAYLYQYSVIPSAINVPNDLRFDLALNGGIGFSPDLSTRYTISAGSYFVAFEGNSFTYDGSELIGGNITSVSVGTIQRYFLIAGTSVTVDENFQLLLDNGSNATIAHFLLGNATYTSTSLVDTIAGGDGNDTFVGGSDGDIFIGGGGDDLYELKPGINIIEYPEGGSADTIYSYETMTIKAVAGVERFALAGTTDIGLTGGTAGDYLTGNIGANLISGLGGNDTLAGGGFYSLSDTLVGGAGNDVYLVEATSDATSVIVEKAGGGNDTVITSVDFTLGDAVQVENLVAAEGTANVNLTGNSFANRLVGNDGTNELQGLGGNDTLIGGAGPSLLEGGAGNDVYFINGAIPSIVEGSSEGVDTVVLDLDDAYAHSYTLADGVENLTVVGCGSSNLVGNILANKLTGSGGADSLRAGEGKDTLAGGSGDDSYYGAGSDDKIIEAKGTAGGIDTMFFHNADGDFFSLVPYANVENITSFACGDVTLTGNGLDNYMMAGHGADLVIGGGGNDTLDYNDLFGVDTLIGGAGDDVYFYEGSKTLIIEAKNSGSDTVIVKTGFSIGDTLAGNVENAFLQTSSSSLTGNSAANVLGSRYWSYYDFMLGTIWGFGSNTLSGGNGNDALIGGPNDTLIGGAGNDIYDLSNSSTDVTIIEESGSTGGIDTVLLDSYMVEFYLPDNVENATFINGDPEDLTGSTLRGNTLANRLTGNVGNDVLISGVVSVMGDDVLVPTDTLADTLVGGLGNDLYILGSSSAKIVEAEGAKGGLDDVVIAYFNIDLAKYANVENVELVGTALNATGNALNNQLDGNSLDNLLKGGAGNDVLTGHGGLDTLDGGSGDDTYTFTGTEKIVDSAGKDTVLVTHLNFSANAPDFDGPSYAFIENITFSGSGNNTATGNAAANILISAQTGSSTLIGAAGNDTLHGVGDGDPASADVLIGGAGNDVYVIDSTYHVIDESTGSGVDTVVLNDYFGAYELAGGIENATVTGTGSEYVVIYGNGLANVMRGDSGDEAFYAYGDTGKDTLYGGNGNDAYYIDGPRDVVKEDAGTAGGLDTVSSIGSFTLPANVENLYMIGTVTATGTGNGLNNYLLSSGVAASLNGAGGNDTLESYYVGTNKVDTLTGGTGADTFVLRLTASDKLDYSLITDFNFAQGDRLAFADPVGNFGLLDQAGLNDLMLGTFGTKDRGVFVDSDFNGVYGAGDDLVAIVKGASLTSVQMASSIYVQ